MQLVTSGMATMSLNDNNKRQASAGALPAPPSTMISHKAVPLPAANTVYVGQPVYRPQLPPNAVMMPYPVMQTPNGAAIVPQSVPPPPSPVYAQQPGIVYYAAPAPAPNSVPAGYSVVNVNGSVPNYVVATANGSHALVGSNVPTLIRPGNAVSLVGIGAGGVPVVGGGANGGSPSSNGAVQIATPAVMGARGVMQGTVPNVGLYSRPPPALPPSLVYRPPPSIVKSPNGCLVASASANPFIPQQTAPLQQQQQAPSAGAAPQFAYVNSPPASVRHPAPVIIPAGGFVRVPSTPTAVATLPAGYGPQLVPAQRYGGAPVLYHAFPTRPLA